MSHQSLQSDIEKAIDHLKAEYSKFQIGRAHTSLIEDVEVQAYGSPSPLKSNANISVMDPKTLKVEPWDKNLIGSVEKGIHEAHLGLNPQNMGEYLLVPIPPMTQERREEMVRKVKEYGEDAKVSLRHAREEARKKIKAEKEDGTISEDVQRDQEREVQEKVDQANKTIEEIMKKKEVEVMSV